MGIRFIGNKQRMLGFIVQQVMDKTGGAPQTFADLFTGTASVARAFKGEGSRVLANDLLKASVTFAEAALLVSSPPEFARLFEVEAALHGYQRTLVEDPLDRVLAYLNEVEPVEGFFYFNYAPTGSAERGVRRQYFTDANARKIDGIRLTLRSWWQRGLLQSSERALLQTSLMLAVNDIANVAGTYGCFLRSWYSRALEPIVLKRPALTPGRTDHEVFQRDANALAKNIRAEVVYIDPPYTKRQYSAYYHVLETIAEDDDPEVWGVTGLRPRAGGDSWNSIYCHKQKAPEALRDLIHSISANYIFLSYSSDGHISHEQIIEILGARGDVEFWAVPLQRYKSNNRGQERAALEERLYCVKCT